MTQSKGDVDLALIIALDVSYSVDVDEFHLMREGLAAALDTKEVEEALLTGFHGAMLICVLQWSGFQEQKIKVKWMRVTDRSGLAAIAHEVRQTTRGYYGGATDIGGALEYCRKLILNTPEKAARMVIDLVADGTNNVNFSPIFERDIAVSMGITINGLAITNEVDGLVDYFTNTIIGGNGAFVEVAKEYTDFELAMRKKLARETQSLVS